MKLKKSTMTMMMKVFFGRFFEAVVDKLAVFKTRAGRAGLVHNFLRGLQVMTTIPLISGLLLSLALSLYFFIDACVVWVH